MIVSGVESTIWSAVLDALEYEVRDVVVVVAAVDANGELAKDCILDSLAAVEENDDGVAFDDIPSVDVYLALSVLTVVVSSKALCPFPFINDILLLTFCINEPSCCIFLLLRDFVLSLHWLCSDAFSPTALLNSFTGLRNRASSVVAAAAVERLLLFHLMLPPFIPFDCTADILPKLPLFAWCILFLFIDNASE